MRYHIDEHKKDMWSLSECAVCYDLQGTSLSGSVWAAKLPGVDTDMNNGPITSRAMGKKIAV